MRFAEGAQRRSRSDWMDVWLWYREKEEEEDTYYEGIRWYAELSRERSSGGGGSGSGSLAGEGREREGGRAERRMYGRAVLCVKGGRAYGQAGKNGKRPGTLSSREYWLGMALPRSSYS
jgi:hypothetical protein